MSETESGKHWLPPAGLERSRPRLVKLTASGKSIVVLSIALGVLAIVAGAALGMVTARGAEESRLLKEEGLVTEGLITRLWRSNDKNNSPRVAYQFTVEGLVYRQDARLPLRVWRTLRTGSYLPIRYVPARPEINHPEGYGRGPVPIWAPFLVAAGLAAGSFLATLPMRGQMRLLASGRAAPGLVTAHGRMLHTSHGANLGQHFSYRFPLLSGAVSTGKGGPSKNPPAVGSTIVVLYDPDNPRRNAVYPLPLVRLTETCTR